MGMCMKKNNRRTMIPYSTTLRGSSNPLHIGDPYGAPPRHHQGSMISNTLQNIILHADTTPRST